MRKWIFILVLFSPAMAFAAPGSCPGGSAYTEPVYGNTTGTLASFGIIGCYYVDFVNGLDTNTGVDESHPWKHAPGMTGCVNTCSSASFPAGTGVILKGGTVWPSSTQLWTFSHSGSGGSPNYAGYDPGWFANVTGTVNTSGTTVTWVSGLHSGNVCTVSTNVTCSGSPVKVGDFVTAMVGQTITITGATCSPCTVASVQSSTSLTVTSTAGTLSGAASSFSVFTRPIISGSNSTSNQMRISGTFIDVDNLEFADMANATACCSQSVSAVGIGSSGNRDVHLYNLYFHGANVAHDGTHASTYVNWPTTGNDNTSTVHHVVWDNSDFCIPGSNGHGPCTMTAMYDGPRQVFMNYVGYMGGSSFVFDNPIDIHNNTIEWQALSVDAGTDHENMIESNGETGSGMVMYNNVIRHGYNCGVVDFQSGPNTGITSYMFNNVLPDMDGCNMQQTYEGSSSLGTADWFNNTAESGLDSGNPGGTCGRSTSNKNHSNVTNQHCISTLTGTSWWSGAANATFTTNLQQTKAGAASFFSSGVSSPAFQPNSVSAQTVAAGTNEGSLCTAISSATTIAAVNTAANAACGQDTSYGVAYDNISHRITGVGRTTTARPGTAWDIGAYQFAAAVTITTPTNGCSQPCVITGGTNGVAYVGFTFTQSGGTGCTWSVIAGSFQTGLSLSSGGVLSGTPTQTTTVTPTVQVSCTQGTASVQVSLTVGGVAATPISTPGKIILLQGGTR